MRTTRINKLGTMTVCPKCGGRQFNVTFSPPVVLESFRGNNYITDSEYMKVECNNCKFIEEELPLDYKGN